uniref:Peptidase C1A papain C-terminal domain-containing protein n=1 Tax=Pipistrellus kuhlii TaxID=59472 RepID=A0A7J7UM53_PIPKU|nr:hypothetical protein mPipKuh1_008771 [Pipistrellus kuhlii]
MEVSAEDLLTYVASSVEKAVMGAFPLALGTSGQEKAWCLVASMTSTEAGETPECSEICEPGYTPSYKEDKHYGCKSYSVPSSEEIMAEIYKNSPVEAAFSVYSHFLMYKSGMDQHFTGEMVGGHAVRILGWGVENGTPY